MQTERKCERETDRQRPRERPREFIYLERQTDIQRDTDLRETEREYLYIYIYIHITYYEMGEEPPKADQPSPSVILEKA